MNRAAFVAIAVALAIPAWAEGPELKDPFEGMYNPKRMLRGAQLTEQQVEQVRQLRRPGRAAERALEKEIEAVWAEFEERLLAEGPIDPTALAALAEKGNRLNAQLDQLKIQNLFKMRDLLSKEQLAAVRQARREMKELEQRTKELEARKRAIPATIAAENAP
jgi:Spy/CpxP family protein refolding chaperone